MSTSSFLETEYIILHDKRDFIDVLKLRIFRWGDYPGLCVWAWSHHNTSDKGGAGAEFAETAMGWQRQNWSDVLWRCSKGPQAKENRWPLEAGRGNRPSPQSLWKEPSADTWHWSSETNTTRDPQLKTIGQLVYLFYLASIVFWEKEMRWPLSF